MILESIGATGDQGFLRHVGYFELVGEVASLTVSTTGFCLSGPSEKYTETFTTASDVHYTFEQRRT